MGCQGSGLGKTKACLVPGLALCLLLGPLAGEGLLCPSVLSPVLSCPPRGWWGPAWGALWGDGCPLPSQGPSLCRMTEVLYCCPLVPALARPGGEGEGAGAWGTWPLDQSGEVGTAGGTGASVLGPSSSPRGHSSDPEDSGIPVSDPWPPSVQRIRTPRLRDLSLQPSWRPRLLRGVSMDGARLPSLPLL